jgi:hypothetical protein
MFQLKWEEDDEVPAMTEPEEFRNYAASVRSGNRGVRPEVEALMAEFAGPQYPSAVTAALSNARFPSLTHRVLLGNQYYPVNHRNYCNITKLMDWNPFPRPAKAYRNAILAMLPAVLGYANDQVQLESVIRSLLIIAGIEPNPGPKYDLIDLPIKRRKVPLSQREENRERQTAALIDAPPVRHSNPNVVMPLLRADMTNYQVESLGVCVEYARKGRCPNRGRCLFHHLNLPEAALDNKEEPILEDGDNIELDDIQFEPEDETSLDPVEENDDVRIPRKFDVHLASLPNGFLGWTSWRYLFALTCWGLLVIFWLSLSLGFLGYSRYLEAQGWSWHGVELCSPWSVLTVPGLSWSRGLFWLPYLTVSWTTVPFLSGLTSLLGYDWWFLGPFGITSPYYCVKYHHYGVLGLIVTTFIFFCGLTMIKRKTWVWLASGFGTLVATYTIENLTEYHNRMAHETVREWEKDKRFVTMRLKDPKYRSVPVVCNMKLTFHIFGLTFTLRPLPRPFVEERLDRFNVDWALFQHLTAPQFMHFDILDEFLRAKLAVGIKTFHDLAYDRSHVTNHQLIMQNTALFAEQYWRYQQQVAGALNAPSLPALNW